MWGVHLMRMGFGVKRGFGDRKGGVGRAVFMAFIGISWLVRKDLVWWRYG